MKAAPLPELVDARTICEETGVKISTAYSFMSRCPGGRIRIEGLRRVFVLRSEVAGLINHALAGRGVYMSPASSSAKRDPDAPQSAPATTTRNANTETRGGDANRAA